MKNKIILFSLLFIAFSTSCNKTSENEDSPNYISIYEYDIDHAEISGTSMENTYSLLISGKQAKKGDLNTQKFETFSQQFKDISYNRPFTLMSAEPIVADTITKIDFICKQAFDSNHPKNSNINDVIDLTFSSVKEYIESNYKDDVEKNIKEPVISFNTAKNVLFTSMIFFTITKKPEVKGSYDITVKGYKNNTMLFETTLKYNFD